MAGLTTAMMRNAGGRDLVDEPDTTTRARNLNTQHGDPGESGRIFSYQLARNKSA